MVNSAAKCMIGDMTKMTMCLVVNGLVSALNDGVLSFEIYDTQRSCTDVHVYYQYKK